ncbi:F-box and leucine-rich repeat protein 6 [Nesidiocoris tenuis]|uniref:F-box and leucine-rich repeat protein 6 n=2 Tax=Nesidiocoris tenuis TaxID=355587 RepID=A0ABN7BBF0_9HEMI|nr:F-box and leucine-rich repeat protein 6 [Nesidiocoris tenuis]
MMEDRNGGDHFEHHVDLYPLSVSDNDHDCLKDFLLDPPQQHPSHHHHPSYGISSLVPPNANQGHHQLPQMGGMPGVHNQSGHLLPSMGPCHPNLVPQTTLHPGLHHGSMGTLNMHGQQQSHHMGPTMASSLHHQPIQSHCHPHLGDMGGCPPMLDSIPSIPIIPPIQQELPPWDNGPIPTLPPCSVKLEQVPMPNHNSSYTPSSEPPAEPPVVTNGDCWSPAAFTASASERTVSSDCVSSETMCSPSDGATDSPLPAKPLCSSSSATPTTTSSSVPPTVTPSCSKSPSVAPEEPPPTGPKKRGRKRKSASGVTTKTTPASSSRPGTTTVTTYHSQISPDQNGIKLRIKKSLTEVPSRVRKKKTKVVEEEEWVEPAEQSPWGDRLPTTVLHNIFKMVTKSEGCVPFLVRVSKVCRLWRSVAISPRLWQHVDLASFWIKDRAQNDLKFRWLCENRLALVHDLNIGGWEFDGIPAILDKMASSCGELRGLSLAGWQGLSAEHLRFLVSHCPKLQRLDLSAINSEMGNPKSAVAMMSLVSLAQEMGERLTQLVLSDNKLSGIPQVIAALSTHCPNLQVLDLSNVRTVSHTTVPFHVEKLQTGCPKLRVLRITNSELVLATASMKEQSMSEGFPLLEELSVATVVENMTAQPVIDDDALLRILKTSHKLRLLDVRGCSRVTDSSLVRVPAWDLEHLFLSGCYVTRINDSGLELICQKWAHSLVEVDLGWSTATQPLDAAVTALANHSEKSPLRILNLCGSSVSVEPVRAILARCPLLTSLNLSSCRGMPRGIKRLYSGSALNQLRENMLKEQANSD